MRSLSFGVKPFDDLRPGYLYQLEVTGFVKSQDPPGIRGCFHNRTHSQEGRKHEHIFAQTTHPEGLTADFLRACRVEPTTGASISTSRLIGSMVGARFTRGEDGSYTISAFQQLKDKTDRTAPCGEHEPASDNSPNLGEGEE